MERAEKRARTGEARDTGNREKREIARGRRANADGYGNGNADADAGF